jgi:peptide/nickel transport system substrate-binding protein
MASKLKSGRLVLLVLLVNLFLAACGTETTPANVPVSGTVSNNATSTTGQASATTATAIATPQAKVSAKSGGTLKVGFIAEPDSLDPAKTATTGGFFIEYIYARLVHTGTDKLPHPWLAESWQNSGDGKTITFKLRPNLKFQDGTTLDAAAVKFSFDRILDPKTASPVKAQFGPLQTVEVVDPLTVAFKFAQPFPSFFTNAGLYSAGIVSPTAVAKYAENFGRNPVGAGPFSFKGWKSGQELVLSRYTDYKNFRQDATNLGPAYLDELDFKIIPQLETQVAALQTGAIDLIGTLSPQDVRRLSQDKNLVVQPVKETIVVSQLEFANKAPFNTEVSLRQAVAYALDKQLILDEAFDGYGVLNPNPLGISVAGWDESAKGYAYDLAKARSLLAAAGWKTGANGILEKDGKPASYTILTTNVDFLKTSAEIIAANLKDVGIEIKIKTVDPPSFLAASKAADYELLFTSTGWYDAFFFSIHFKTPGWNGQFNDAKLDDLITKLDTTLDPTQRLDLTKQIQQYINSQALVVPVLSRWSGVVFNKKVQGFKTDMLGNPLYNEVWLS